MKKTEMLKKNYEFKVVLTKGNFFIEKEIDDDINVGIGI